MELDGYNYYATRKPSNYKWSRYYYCVRRRSLMCPGAIKINNRTGEVTILENHNGHEQELDHLPKFRAKLIKRAITERTSNRRIYDEEAARNADVALLYPFSMAETAMNSARRRNNPPIPDTLKDLGEIMLSPEWRPRFALQVDVAEEPVLKNIIQGPEGVALLFSSQTLIDRVVDETEEIHVDGSFEFVPSVPPTSHLLVIHVVLREKTIPVAFCLMENRTQALYERVFQSFVALSPTLRPVMVITDYEKGLRTSLINTYPEAQVVGCYYHYANTLWKKAAALGYIRDIQPDTKQCLKMLMALPFAPSNKIIEGVGQIREWADNIKLNLEHIFVYMQRYWIESIGPEHISVSDCHCRTNNNVEVFNKTLQSAMGNHPNIFHFIDELRSFLMRFFVQYRQFQNGLRVSGAITSKYLSRGTKIRDARVALRREQHSLFHFLEIVANYVDNIGEKMYQAVKPTHKTLEIISTQPSASTSAVPETKVATNHSQLGSEKMSFIKTCLVKCCKNNSNTIPSKYFILVPIGTDRRKMWFKALGMEGKSCDTRTKFYVCEDHFDLQEDAENWMFFKIMGKKLFMKKHVVPHKGLDEDTSRISSPITSSEKERKRRNSESSTESVTKKKLLCQLLSSHTAPGEEQPETNIEINGIQSDDHLHIFNTATIKSKEIKKEKSDTNSEINSIQSDDHLHIVDTETVKSEEIIRKEKSDTNLEINGIQSDDHLHIVDTATIKSEGIKIEEDHSEIEENNFEVDKNNFRIEESHFEVEKIHFGIEENHSGSHFEVEKNHFGIEKNHSGIEENHFRIEENHFRIEENHFGIEENNFQVEKNHFGIEENYSGIEENNFEVEKSHFGIEENHFDFLWNNTPNFPNEFWSMNKVIDDVRYIIYSKFIIRNKMPVAEKQIMVKSDLQIEYFVLHKSWNTVGCTDMLTCAQEIEEIIYKFDVLPICKEEPNLNDHPEEYIM